MKQLILDLRKAEIGDKSLDNRIAEVGGWKRVVEEIRGESGQANDNIVWLDPSTLQPARVPQFSTSIDAALDLIAQFAPNSTGGLSWELDTASARVGVEGRYIEATTPALALCIAALIVKYKSDGE